MWFFNSPQIIYGEGSLAYLEQLQGRLAFIVTDANLHRLGYVERVCRALAPGGVGVEVFAEVESDPCIETVQRGAAAMTASQPDWIIALGGGSVMDAAKAMWVLYERPDLVPEAINPIENLGLRQKARLVAIPTTAGTGSEATWAIVLTDTAEQRKLGLGNRENLPDLAILDPELVQALPARLTADTGLDALVHAVEGFTSTFHNDFSDGLCLQAAQLIFTYLPLAYADGNDLEARTHLQNAAAMAGLGFGNSMAALAHGMGHALGGVLHIPHGRAVALSLPFAVEYCAHPDFGPTRYGELARFLGLAAGDETQAAAALASAIRALERQVGQPLTIKECGVSEANFGSALERLVDHALTDSQTIMSTRIPDSQELEQLFRAAYVGEQIQF